MIYFFEILLIAFNIWMAWKHSKMIGNGVTPKHGWWGLLYIVVAAGLSIISHSWLPFILSLLIRKVVFDAALNLFRGLPLFYVSSSTTSIIDRLHRKVFGKRSEVYQSVYLLLIVIINFLT